MKADNCRCRNKQNKLFIFSHTLDWLFSPSNIFPVIFLHICKMVIHPSPSLAWSKINQSSVLVVENKIKGSMLHSYPYFIYQASLVLRRTKERSMSWRSEGSRPMNSNAWSSSGLLDPWWRWRVWGWTRPTSSSMSSSRCLGAWTSSNSSCTTSGELTFLLIIIPVQQSWNKMFQTWK